LKDAELAAYEKTRKKKDPDLDRNTLKPRLPDMFLHKIVTAKINSPACMNKGFILDGFPRNTADAAAVFLTPIADEVEPKEGVPGFEDMDRNEKIEPQYVVMFEAEDAYLKARSKEIAALPQRQDNHTEAQTDKRMKIYREHNPSATDAKHLFAFFQTVIGSQACMMRQVQPPQDEKTPQEVEAETLVEIQAFCEQNGKPCCINLITEGDLKFLKSLEEVKQADPPAVNSTASNDEGA
jgi:adenylate kinase family enzyme